MILALRSMHILLFPVLRATSTLVIANTLLGSVVGFVFWGVAARVLSPEQFGLGAAYVSAVTLLIALSEMGIGTVVMRFAPGLTRERAVFINASLSLIVGFAGITATIFAIGAPLWSPALSGITRSPFLFPGFIATAILLGVAQLLDRVFVAFEQAECVIVRTLLSGLTRVGLLVFAAGSFGSSLVVLAIAAGAAVSMLSGMLRLRKGIVGGYRPRPVLGIGFWKGRLGYAAGNHLASLLWGLPTILYPLIVVDRLGPRANAVFYVHWMIANLLFIVPLGITTAAFVRACNTGNMDEQRYWRLTRLMLVGLTISALAMSAVTPPLLQTFGSDYRDTDHHLSLLLLVSALPYACNTALITWHRIGLRTRSVVLVSATIVSMSLGLSTILAGRYGVTGIGIGWLAGQAIGLSIGWVSYHHARTAAEKSERRETTASIRNIEPQSVSLYTGPRHPGPGRETGRAPNESDCRITRAETSIACRRPVQ